MIDQEPENPTKPNKEKLEPSFFALTKERLREAIKQVLAKTKVDFIILVMDNTASHLIHGMFSSIELSLLKINITYRFGQLRRPRKYDALYIIDSDTKSVEEICNDFKDPRNQKYLDAHVLALNILKQEQLEMMRKERNLLQHLHTLNELDLGYIAHLENSFDLGMKGYFNESASDPWRMETTQRLGTAILCYHPFNELSISYCPKHERLAKDLAKYLVDRIDTLGKANIKGCQRRTPKIRVLLLDRQVDLMSPIMRDYDYLPLVFDVFEVRNCVLPLGKDEKHSLRPDFDKVWEDIKFQSIEQAGETLSKIATDIKGFANQRPQQVNEQLAKLEQKISVVEQLRLHTGLVHEINNNHGPALTPLTALEQTIANGINEVGQKLKDAEIYHKVCDFFKVERKIDEVNYLRLVSLCLLSLELKPSQANSLMDIVKLPEFKNLPKQIAKISLKPHKLNQLPQGEDIQLLFRHQSEVVRYIAMFLKNALQQISEQIVPIERPRKDLKSVSSNPKLFVFVEGYLGFNEIVAINRLQSLQNERIICGSHLLVSPRDYLEEILETKTDK